MRKLSSFNFITLNGFLSDNHGDISWHMHGPEENQYASDSLKAGNTLLFGRKTYEMMASYWPTPAAAENDPAVAEGMNRADKIVISQSLKKAEWLNTSIISNNATEEIRKLKQLPGSNLTLLGSGTILTLLADAGLVDEYLIMIDPVAIGSGVSVFSNIKHSLNLKLLEVKTFKSGVVLLRYKS